MSGIVAQPGESSYDEAVSIWNASCARRPAIVARCTSSADVAAALHFARRQDLVVSVRGGGHNYAGGALCDDGLMIDLTPMKAVSVDADARRAKCGGGTTWGELDAATQAHGLAVPGGFISRTGVAGLTLGGGFGWLCAWPDSPRTTLSAPRWSPLTAAFCDRRTQTMPICSGPFAAGEAISGW